MIKKIIFIIICLNCILQNANAQQIKTIILSLPLSGEFAPLGKTIEQGFLQAVKDKKQNINFKIIDDKCKTTTIKNKINEFINADIAIGFLCFDVALTLAQHMKQSQKTLPIITLDSRHSNLNYLRDFETLPIYELSPAHDDEAKAIFNFAFNVNFNFDGTFFNNKNFALLDDGSTYARDLSDNLHLLSQTQNKQPTMIDDIPPLQENYYNLIKNMKNKNIQAAIIIADKKSTDVFLQNITTENFPIPIIVTTKPTILSHENIMFIDSAFMQNNSQVKNDEFTEGYTLAEIAIASIQTNDITARLNQPFTTTLGEITFKDGRGGGKNFVAYVLQNQKFVLYNKQ